MRSVVGGFEQESSIPEERRLDAAAVDRFVQHYERITLRMLDSTSRAGVRIGRSFSREDHSVERLERAGTRERR